MKKEKVLALLLTAAMSVTAAAPVSAAELTDETAAVDVFDTEDAEVQEDTVTEAQDEEIALSDDAEITEEGDAQPEILVDEAAGDYEDGGDIELTDEEDIFSDNSEEQIATQAASASNIKGTITLKNNRWSTTGRFPSSSDARGTKHYYEFTPQTGGKLKVTGTSSGISGGVFLELALADSGEILKPAGVIWNNPMDDVYYLTKGTTYLIGIQQHSVTDYKLAVEFTPVKESFPEKYYEQKEEWYDAKQISLNTMYHGMLGAGDDTDWFKFTVPSYGKYKINMTSNGSIQFCLHNASGEAIRNWGWLYGDQNTEECTLEKGTYYMGYKKEDGNQYTFSVNSHTHSYKTSSVTKATPNQNGRLVRKCSDCGETITSTIYRPTSVKLSATTYTYNGKAKKPGVTVTDANGNTLSRSSYSVSYDRDSKSAGRHTVKITLKGNYRGTMKRSYTINPRATSVSKLSKKSKGFTVKVKKLSAATATGYQVQYSLNSSFKGAKTKTISGTSLTVKRLKGNKKYYVRVRTYKKSGSKKYYSSWSAVKAVKTRR